MEGYGGLAVLIGLHADPLGFEILGEDVMCVSVNLDALVVFKLAIAFPVNLQREGNRFVRCKVHNTSWETMNQKRVGRNACRHWVIHVNRAGGIARAPFFQVFDLTKPEVGLWLADHGITLDACLIRGEHELAVPLAEIRDVADVAGDWFNARALAGGEIFGELEEHAVHVHEHVLFSNVTNTWPLGEPAVLGIVVEAALGK